MYGRSHQGQPASPTTALTEARAIARPVQWAVMVEAADIKGLAPVEKVLLASDAPADFSIYPVSRLISTVTVGT